MYTTEELLVLQKENERKAQELQRLQGSLDTQIKQLEQQYNCATVREAEQLIANLDAELNELQAQETTLHAELKQLL